jgi:hypothetical protein
VPAQLGELVDSEFLWRMVARFRELKDQLMVAVDFGPYPIDQVPRGEGEIQRVIVERFSVTGCAAHAGELAPELPHHVAAALKIERVGAQRV